MHLEWFRKCVKLTRSAAVIKVFAEEVFVVPLYKAMQHTDFTVAIHHIVFTHKHIFKLYIYMRVCVYIYMKLWFEGLQG